MYYIDFLLYKLIQNEQNTIEILNLHKLQIYKIISNFPT
jgi:hypothetical protein